MKHEWKDAPAWANYVAGNANGNWWWFQKKPEYDPDQQIWINPLGMCRHAGKYAALDAILEERPHE